MKAGVAIPGARQSAGHQADHRLNAWGRARVVVRGIRVDAG